MNAESATESIEGLKSCKAKNKIDIENPSKSMASQTSDAKKYTTRIGHANLTIIDTPGFGDSRGTEWDAKNFERIKEIVLKSGGINCVCVIQNGRDARVHAQLKYSYSTLTSILPKAIEN